MSRRLLVINSFGPMGSTLLAGLVEKFGYTNLPVRKLRLHQYLMGELDLNSGVMQDRLEQNLLTNSLTDFRGGISVLDRNEKKEAALVDFNRIRPKLEELKNKKFETLSDLYFACRTLCNEAVIYKNMDSHEDWQIELTVDLHRYDPKEIFSRYQQEFETVHMLHLTRDFRGWINSLASQAFYHKQWQQRLKFFPHMRYRDFALYEQTTRVLPGLHIAFDALFDQEIESLASEIGGYLGLRVPPIDFRKESYDLYGKIVPYEKAFTRFDDRQVFLRPETLAYYDRVKEKSGFSCPGQKLCAWFKYLKDMRCYRQKYLNPKSVSA